MIITDQIISINNPPKNGQGTGLYNATYYVINTDFRVYICLEMAHLQKILMKTISR